MPESHTCHQELPNIWAPTLCGGTDKLSHRSPQSILLRDARSSPRTIARLLQVRLWAYPRSNSSGDVTDVDNRGGSIPGLKESGYPDAEIAQVRPQALRCFDGPHPKHFTIMEEKGQVYRGSSFATRSLAPVREFAAFLERSYSS